MIEEKHPDYLKFGDGHVDITLASPVALTGQTTSTIRMREPTVKDQIAAEAMKGSDLQRDAGYFANLCDLTPKDIEALPLKAYKRVQAAFFALTD